jgi:hypothetical protein
MEEVAVEVIHKLPVWYLEVLIPILIVVGVWVFSHLRRDKQGKLYWFSRNYEDKKLVAKLDTITKQADDVNRRTSRLEILDLIVHRPQARDLILQKYDDYKTHGWNSYIDTVVEEWKRDNHHYRGEVKA